MRADGLIKPWLPKPLLVTGVVKTVLVWIPSQMGGDPNAHPGFITLTLSHLDVLV